MRLAICTACAGRALAEVVGGGDHDRAARVRVGRDLEVRAVGAVHRARSPATGPRAAGGRTGCRA